MEAAGCSPTQVPVGSSCASLETLCAPKDQRHWLQQRAAPSPFPCFSCLCSVCQRGGLEAPDQLRLILPRYSLSHLARLSHYRQTGLNQQGSNHLVPKGAAGKAWGGAGRGNWETSALNPAGSHCPIPAWQVCLWGCTECTQAVTWHLRTHIPLRCKGPPQRAERLSDCFPSLH